MERLRGTVVLQTKPWSKGAQGAYPARRSVPVAMATAGPLLRVVTAAISRPLANL